MTPQDPTEPSPPERLSEQLHPILEDWSQLIGSLAELIRENVEGLLPAVFGLAQLAQRASEAQLGSTQGARSAGAGLRQRLAALREALQPLELALRETAPLREQLPSLAERARGLRARLGDDAELADFLDAVTALDDGALGRADRLIAAAEAVESVGMDALDRLEQELDRVDELLHEDAAELEAAAARVRQFVESSRASIQQLIVKLQFQDRTDQILSHLLADFESLRRALEEVGDRPFDLEAWRAERRRRFTTEEERKAGSGAVSTEPGDIELF